MSAIPHDSFDWQEGFLRVLPAVETHAKIQFRRLTADRREEAIQETIAAAVAIYRLAAVQGKLNVVCPSSLANFAVRHTKTGRHVGGNQDGAKDPLSPICRRRHGVEIISHDRHHVTTSLRDASTAGWKQIAVEDRKVSVPDLAAFRIDFPRWLRMLTGRDRSVISALIAGEHPSAIADRFNVTRGRISQLRRKFEQLWRKFQGEAEAAA